MHHPINRLTSSPSKTIADFLFQGSFHEAFSLYKHLHSSDIPVSPSILPSLLKACSTPQSLAFALQLHCSILKTNHISNPITLNSLLSVYSKHSMVEAARKLFDTSPLKDPITWNSMVNCYFQNGYFSESVKVFMEMNSIGLEPKPELIAAILSACGRTENLRLGRAIHARAILKCEMDLCVLFPTSLIDMYSKCGDLDSALRVFGLMQDSNVVSWTAMVSGCVTNGRYDLSIDLFRGMVVEGIEPNRAAVIAVLPACGELGALKIGKEIHRFILRYGFELESRVVGALIQMYSKCPGSIRLASLVFERAEGRDVVSWSSMMLNYSRLGDNHETFKLFQRMRRDGVDPNYVTILAVITACTNMVSLDHGHAMLGYILKSCFSNDVFVGNSLINMFAKCGCIDSSDRIFSEMMPIRDTISYSSMIQSYAVHGRGYDALRLFKEMQHIGFKPDGITILVVLSACNHSGLVDESKEVLASRYGGANWVLEHYACYVDLLGRNGRIDEACEVIQRMPMKPSSKMLSSLVSACRDHARFEAAKDLAQRLIDLEPENAANYTLLSMIYAENGNWVGVEEIRRVMRDKGVRKTYASSKIEDGSF